MLSRERKIVFIVLVSAFLIVSGCVKKSKTGTVSEKWHLNFDLDVRYSPDEAVDSVRRHFNINTAEGAFALACVKASLGDFSFADSEFLRAADIGNDDASLLIAVADYFCLYRRDDKTAEKLLKIATTLDTPLREKAYLRLGEIMFRRNDRKSATKFFLEGADISSDSLLMDNWIHVAEVLNRLNLISDASKLLGKISQRFPNSPKPMSQLLSLGCPDTQDVLRKLAKISPFDRSIVSYVEETFPHNRLNIKDKEYYGALIGNISIFIKGEDSTAIRNLLKLSDEPGYQRRLADFILMWSGEKFQGTAYRLLASSASRESNPQKALEDSILALKILLDGTVVFSNNAFKTQVFWGSEPDFAGAVLSLTTEKRDMNELAENIENGQAKLWTQMQSAEKLGNILSRNVQGDIANRVFDDLLDFYTQIGDTNKALYLIDERVDNLTDTATIVKLLVRKANFYKMKRDKFSFIKVIQRIYTDYPEHTLEVVPLLQFTDGILSLSEKQSLFDDIVGHLKKVQSMGKVSNDVLMQIWRHRIALDKVPKPSLVRSALEIQFDSLFATHLLCESNDDAEKFLMDRYGYDISFLNTWSAVKCTSGNSLAYAFALADSFPPTSDDIKGLMRSAVMLERNSRFKEAFDRYRKLLLIRPQCRWVWQKLAELSLSFGDTVDARLLYQRMLILSPGNEELPEIIGDISPKEPHIRDSVWRIIVYDEPLSQNRWGKLATLFWYCGELEKSSETIAKAREFFGNAGLFAKEMGAIWDWLGKSGNAFEEFALSLADDFDPYTTLEWMKRILRRSKDKQGLIYRFSNIVKEHPSTSGIDALRELLPEYGDTNLFLKTLLSAAKNAGNTAILDKCISMFRKFRDKDKMLEALKCLCEKASDYEVVSISSAMKSLEKMGASKDAEELLKKMVRKYPKRRVILAEFYMRNKNFSRAVEEYSKIFREDSTNTANVIALAKALGASGNVRKAREVLTYFGEKLKAENRKNEIKLVRTELTRTYLTDSPMDALSAYERLINNYPLDEALLRETWSFAREKGLTRKLIDYYESVAKDSPKDYKWDIVLYYLNLWNYDGERALEWLIKACDNEPTRVELWEMRRACEISYGKWKSALHSSQKIAELSDYNSDIARYLTWFVNNQGDSVYSSIVRKLDPGEFFSSLSVVRELIRYGFLKQAENLISATYVPIGQNSYLETMADILAETYELEGNFEKAFSTHQDLMNKISSRSYYEWDIKRRICKMVKLAERWNMLEDLYKQVVLPPRNSFEKYLFEKIYQAGGEPVLLASTLDSPTSAASILRCAGESEKLLNFLRKNWTPISSDLDMTSLYAVSLAESGSDGIARRVALTIAECNPYNAYNWYRIALIFEKMKRYKDALKSIERAMKLLKHADSRLLETYVRLLIENNEHKKAIETLRKYDIYPSFNLIRVISKIGDKKPVLELFRKRWRDQAQYPPWYYEEEEDYDNGIHDDTYISLDYSDECRDYYYRPDDEEDGVYDISLNEDSLLLNLGFENPLRMKYGYLISEADNDWAKSRWRMEWARACLKYGQYDEALSLADNIIGSPYGSDDAVRLKASILAKKKNYKQSIDLYEKAGFSSFSDMITLAEFYYFAGDSIKGDEVLTRVLAAIPGREQMISLGFFAINNRRVKIAERCAHVVSSIWSVYPPAIMLKAQSLFLRKEYGQSLKLSRELSSAHSFPDIALDALILWVNSAEKLGVLDRQMKSVEDSISVAKVWRKFDLMAFLVYGKISQKDFAGANLWAERLTSEFPHSKQAWKIALYCYEKSGDKRVHLTKKRLEDFKCVSN